MSFWKFSLAALLLMAIPVTASDTARFDHAPFTNAEIERVVYHWFSLYQHNASIDRYLALIGDKGVEKAFRQAHVQNLRSFKSLSPEVRKLTVQSLEDGSRLVDADVEWSTRGLNGQDREFRTHEILKLADDGGRMPKIVGFQTQ